MKDRASLDAACAGVRRFIFTSAARSDPNHPHRLFRAKGQTEAALRASGLDYTILASLNGNAGDHIGYSDISPLPDTNTHDRAPTP